MFITGNGVGTPWGDSSVKSNWSMPHPSDLSSIPKTHIKMEGKTDSKKFSGALHTYAVIHTYTQKHI